MQAIGELRQEACRSDCAAFAAGHIGEVGKVALEAFGIFFADRHRPGAIVGALAGFEELMAQGLVVAEQADTWLPRATTQAPVSVAMSMIVSGLKRRA